MAKRTRGDDTPEMSPERAAALGRIKLISIERPPEGRRVEIGDMVAVSAVEASNIVRDVREMVTNALGGRMRRYERLIEATMARAELRFRAELEAHGYDGAVGVRYTHPKIVDGGAELIVFGTGFRYLD